MAPAAACCSVAPSRRPRCAAAAAATPYLPRHHSARRGHPPSGRPATQLVSLANTAVSLAASPLILWASDAPPLMRVGLAASIAGFGLFTTGALHWFSRPYVHELRYDPGSQELVAQTVTLLGGMR